MDSTELRERFLAFFERHGHTRVATDSLIPSGDPTVLFTSAGMNQFKEYFLGKRTDLSRAASCQTCLRTGDLEQVGKTASHHTFFEMLGNFSFGDYFKREAIAWAWEFLVEDIKLPKNRLWVTVFEQDDEASSIWQREIKVPAHKIVRLGEADNFWPANARTLGPNGPCGPCSEVHFDRTLKCREGRSGCAPGCDCGRFVEVWNLVFTQFDRQEGGRLEPLPRKNIDTGMGLERLASVVQGTETDYETDLFEPIVKGVTEHFILSLKENERSTVYTVADHLRAIVFLLAENLIPSNDGRGYVLRMLIRRAHWHCGRLLWNRKSTVRGEPEYLEPFLSDMVSCVIETYKDVYPKLDAQRKFIRDALKVEEQRFVETLDAGNEQIQVEFERLKTAGIKRVSGDFAFKMKDTYGYPPELLADIAEREDLQVDHSVFEQRLAEQRERSRAASQFGTEIFTREHGKLRGQLQLEMPKEAQFIGYELLSADVTVKGILKQDQIVSEAREGDEVGIILDRSPFYGESGGQVGDRGRLEALHGLLEVVNVSWVDDLLVHHAKVHSGTVKVNEPIRARVDPERRAMIARSHTATHLLHWALRKVLGPETVQAGSLVDADRIRFDFSALSALRDEQRVDVESLVNARVRLADAVQAEVMRFDAAKRLGALALFGEKYGDQVRVVSIGDYSRELCGGTHLLHTGFVGTFRIVGESSIAAGTRRIEALVGEAAVRRVQEEVRLLHEVAERLGRSPQEVLSGFEELVQQIKQAERQVNALTVELARVRAKHLVADAKQIDGVAFVVAHIDRADRELLAALADAVKAELKGGIVLLVSSNGNVVSWVMALTADVVKRGLHAGKLLKEISAITQGGGGGRPDFAQAGGKDPSQISAALKRAETMVREALAK